MEIPKTKQGRWIAATILVAVALLAFLILGRDLVRQWRADALLRKQAVLIEQGKWDEAYPIVQSALNLAPHYPPVLEAMAFILGRSRQWMDLNLALEYWHRLEEIQNLTNPQRRELLRVAVRLQRIDLLEKWFLHVLAQKDQDIVLLKMLAGLFLEQGFGERAMALSERGLKMAPADWDLLLIQLNILNRQSDESTRERIWRLLSRQLNEASAPVPWALAEFIDRAQWLSDRQLRACARFFEDRGGGKQTPLFMMDLKVRMGELSLEEAAERVKERARANEADAEAMIPAVRWLNRNRRYEDTVEILQAEKAYAEHEDLLLAFLDALFVQEKLDEVEELLKTESMPLDPVLKNLFLTRLYQIKEDDLIADRHWGEVLRLGKTQPAKLWFAAEYAEKALDREKALAAFELLSQLPTHAQRAYRKLMRMHRGEPAKLADILLEFTDKYPAETNLRLYGIYLDLLLGRNVSERLETLNAMRGTQSMNKEIPLLTAFALHRQGRVEEALALFDAIDVSPEQLTQRQGVLAAYLLMEHGREAEARKLAGLLPTEQLRKEEAGLIEKLL